VHVTARHITAATSATATTNWLGIASSSLIGSSNTKLKAQAAKLRCNTAEIIAKLIEVAMDKLVCGLPTFLDFSDFPSPKCLQLAFAARRNSPILAELSSAQVFPQRHHNG